MYHTDARKFIDKIIRMRERIIRLNKSLNSSAPHSIDVINTYLGHFPCNTDEHMARFYTKHFNHILNILPGGHSKNFAAIRQEAMNLNRMAGHILNSEKPEITMAEIETIHQGIPKQTFFMVAMPHTGNNGRMSLDAEKPKYQYQLKAPDGTLAKAELHDMYVWNLYDVPDGFCLLSYGIKSDKLIPLLEKKYPEFKTVTKVEFLVLKRI